MSIESVTRACYARALSPEAVSPLARKDAHFADLSATQWEGLLAQLPASDDETELCGQSPVVQRRTETD